ncbi:kinase-like domain-containing protein [Hypoxylon fuscum]|nr:kinase-like domain-containing protein [Hypoxylon fuscum]
MGETEAVGALATTLEHAASSQLPTVPEEVTASWLAGVLGTKIKSINLEKVLPGTATKLYISVEYESDEDADEAAPRPTHLCVKGGFTPAFVESTPWIVVFYQREVEFFNRVAPSLDRMEVPKTLWAGSNAKQGIIVMDDLVAQGCEFSDSAEVWPVSWVLSGVEQLAALHAKTWGAELVDYPWLTSGASDYDHAILTLMQTFDTVADDPRRPAVRDYLTSQERVTAALKKHNATRNKPKFRCLLHGDPHTGNTYLSKGAPRFCDWQVVQIGSAFHDIAYFVGGALSIEDRRAHEWEIVDHYLATLEKLGAPAFSRKQEDVLREYRKSFLSGVGWVLCPYSMQPEKQVHAMAARYVAALKDHKVLELVESLLDVE